MTDSKVLAVRLPSDLYKQVHHRSVDEGRPVREIVMEALEQYHEHDWVLVEAAAKVTYYECRVDGCKLVGEDRHG